MKSEKTTTGRETTASRSGPRDAQASPEGVARNAYPRPVAWLPQLAAVIASLLREVFDESAYRRFLERNRMSSSPTAYAAFREENDRLKAQRPKCC
ncbi:MAG TPA: hypothetical protein VEK33_23685 [Terriglobales bacterium]|nr:hypothetical protein [Terriglobales bacterium]